jgi:hypothetical protein
MKDKFADDAIAMAIKQHKDFYDEAFRKCMEDDMILTKDEYFTINKIIGLSDDKIEKNWKLIRSRDPDEF